VTFFNTVILADVHPAGGQIAPLGGDEIRASGVEDISDLESSPRPEVLTELTDLSNGLLLNPPGMKPSNEH